MNEEERDGADEPERRAIDAALRIAGEGAPLGDHPAHRSAWRRTAAREAVDSGMEGR